MNEQDTTPAYLPTRILEGTHPFESNSLGYLGHVHALETGRCIKNRFGPKCTNYNDPFESIRGFQPHQHQKKLLNAICHLVDLNLESWSKASGKTTLRLMLAQRIIRDDD